MIKNYYFCGSLYGPKEDQNCLKTTYDNKL